MVVTVLAGVVTLGLVTFYLNSQIMWTESSTQALAQRDATFLLEVMRDSTRNAASAQVVNPADPNHLVIFYDRNNNELNRFFWNAADSCVHYGTPDNLDHGAVVRTTVERFRASIDPVVGLVTIDSLTMRSTAGGRITLSTSIGLYNQ
jgi:hypothetical protein